jgi:hypothetical protein
MKRIVSTAMFALVIGGSIYSSASYAQQLPPTSPLGGITGLLEGILGSSLGAPLNDLAGIVEGVLGQVPSLPI